MTTLARKIYEYRNLLLPIVSRKNRDMIVQETFIPASKIGANITFKYLSENFVEE